MLRGQDWLCPYSQVYGLFFCLSTILISTVATLELSLEVFPPVG